MLMVMAAIAKANASVIFLNIVILHIESRKSGLRGLDLGLRNLFPQLIRVSFTLAISCSRDTSRTNRVEETLCAKCRGGRA